MLFFVDVARKFCKELQYFSVCLSNLRFSSCKQKSLYHSGRYNRYLGKTELNRLKKLLEVNMGFVIKIDVREIVLSNPTMTEIGSGKQMSSKPPTLRPFRLLNKL